MPSLPSNPQPGDPDHTSHHGTVHDLVNPVNAPFVIAQDDQGTFAARPAAGTAGRYYWATDTSQLFRDDGSVWDEITVDTSDHDNLTGVSADDHHAQAHAIGGGDHTGTLDHGALSGLTDDDHTQYQKESEKGQANGYAELDGSGDVPDAQIAAAIARAADVIAKDIVDAKGDLIVATAADTVARLALGNDGEVLTADSNESAGVKWAAAAGGGGGGLIVPASGVWYGPWTEIVTTTAWSKEHAMAIPFPIAASGTIDALAVSVNVGQADTEARVGVYDDSGGLPGDLLHDAGTVATTSAGAKEITGLSISVSPPLVWLVAVIQGTGTKPTMLGMVDPAFLYSFGSASNNPLNSAPDGAAVQIGVTGALPDPFGTPNFYDNDAIAVAARFA